MVDFKAFNASTHRIIKKDDDYNSILDHAFVKADLEIERDVNNYIRAISPITGKILFGGTNLSTIKEVFEASCAFLISLGGGSLHVRGYSIPYLTAEEIDIPITDNGSYDVSLHISGDGKATMYKATAPMAAVIKRIPNEVYSLSGTTRHARITLTDFWTDCNSGLAEIGVDVSEPDYSSPDYGYECPKEIGLYRLGSRGASLYNFSLDHCDNSVIEDCIAENPHGAGQALLYRVRTGKVKIIRGWYDGDIVSAAQQIVIDNPHWSGLYMLQSTGVCTIYSPESPAAKVLSTNNLIEVAEGESCDLLEVIGGSVVLLDNTYMVYGQFTKGIDIDTEFFTTTGNSYIFPSYPAISSKTSFPVYANVRGQMVSGGGNLYLHPTDEYVAGVNIKSLDLTTNLGTYYGNRKINEEAAGGSATHKDITFPEPYCTDDANYLVHWNIADGAYTGTEGEIWITNKTNKGCRINFVHANGWALNWSIEHLGRENVA